MLELPDFQVNQHEALQQAVVEDEGHEVVLLIEGKPNLAAGEQKAFAEFKHKMLQLVDDSLLQIRIDKRLWLLVQVWSCNQAVIRHVIGVTIPEGAHCEEVVLHLRPNRAPYVLTKPLHPMQEPVKHDAAGLVVRLHVMVNRELEAELLFFGPDVRVLQPLSLADKLWKLHQEAGEAYREVLSVP